MRLSRDVIAEHWRSANAREWDTFAALLAPDMVYEAPQTRERVRSAEGYLDMFRTWPGDWRVELRQLVADEHAAVSVLDFIVGDEVMTGISVFTLREGRIAKVTDYWPSAYEPPPRVSRWMERY